MQLEVIERVEQAGGEIYAIDHGRLTNGTAATRMSNNMMGAAFQYYAEVTGEKVAAAQERVVARGVLPNSRISPGYVRGADGVLVVECPKARIVVEAFKRRDRGAPLVEIQALLAENGIERSISGVASMLRSRMPIFLSSKSERADRDGLAGQVEPHRVSLMVMTTLPLPPPAWRIGLSASRNSRTAGTNRSWYWKMPPCPESG